MNVVKNEAVKAWEKLANPTVSRGKTAFPKSQKEQERLGIRLYYDGGVTQMVSNTTNIRFSQMPKRPLPQIEQWKKKNGGTHAVMGSIYVKDGTEEEVDTCVTEGLDSIEGL